MIETPMFYISHDGSMVLLYGVPWIPSIYPLYVSIYIYTSSHLDGNKTSHVDRPHIGWFKSKRY
jgi:hypothetical protein